MGPARRQGLVPLRDRHKMTARRAWSAVAGDAVKRDGTGLAACILVFRAAKAPERRGQVLVIDASDLYQRGRNQNTLEPDHVDQVFAWYQEYENVEGAAQVATLSEIAENDWNLNIPRYAGPAPAACRLAARRRVSDRPGDIIRPPSG